MAVSMNAIVQPGASPVVLTEARQLAVVVASGERQEPQRMIPTGALMLSDLMTQLAHYNKGEQQ